jgi:predicted methyltransferase
MTRRPFVLAHAVLLSMAATVALAQDASPPPNFPVLPPPSMDAPAVAAAAPIDRVLAGDWRSDANKARDRYRHPRETLAFFGVKPGDAVLEIWPGGGWYAEVLAPLLRDAGHYTAVVPRPGKPGDNTAKSNDSLRARFAKAPAVYGAPTVVEVDPAAPVLGAPGSADVVLTFRNAHNWVMAGNEAAMFKAFFAVLKPGGTLGVVDHRAHPDQPPAEMKTSGYLPEAYVIGLAKAAGFQLAESSEINANPRDTKDYAEGVWTLPPVLTLGDKDRDKYLAIGESDRMTLRFTKPGR